MKTFGDLSFRTWLIALVALMIGVATCLLTFVEWNRRVSQELEVRYEQAKSALARELGVQDINDYPHPESFPVGYFEVKLQGGMPITTVHEIVRGYAAVQHCPGNREVYDFYDTYRSYGISVSMTKRIEIRYDDQGRYLEKDSLKIDDPNSDPIDTTGCVPGRIGE